MFLRVLFETSWDDATILVILLIKQLWHRLCLALVFSWYQIDSRQTMSDVFYEFYDAAEETPLNFHQLAVYICLLQEEARPPSPEICPLPADPDELEHQTQQHPPDHAADVAPDAYQQDQSSSLLAQHRYRLFSESQKRRGSWLGTSVCMVLSQIVVMIGVYAAVREPACSKFSASNCPLGRWCREEQGQCTWCGYWYEDLCREFNSGEAWSQHVADHAAGAGVVPQASTEELLYSYFAPRKKYADDKWDRAWDTLAKSLDPVEDFPPMCWRCFVGTAKPDVGASVRAIYSQHDQTMNKNGAAPQANVRSFTEETAFMDTMRGEHAMLAEMNIDSYIVFLASCVIVALAVCRELKDIQLCKVMLDAEWRQRGMFVSQERDRGEKIGRFWWCASAVPGGRAAEKIAPAVQNAREGGDRLGVSELREFGDEERYRVVRDRDKRVVGNYVVGSEQHNAGGGGSSSSSNRKHLTHRQLTLLSVICYIRRFGVIPLVAISVPSLVIYRGRDCLSICLNAVAILFLLEIDNLWYDYAVIPSIKASFELTYRSDYRLSQHCLRRIGFQKTWTLACMPLGMLGMLYLAGGGVLVRLGGFHTTMIQIVVVVFSTCIPALVEDWKLEQWRMQQRQQFHKGAKVENATEENGVSVRRPRDEGENNIGWRKRVLSHVKMFFVRMISGIIAIGLGVRWTYAK